jgi:hypothetical protein
MDLLNDMIRAGSHGDCNCTEPMQAATTLLTEHGSVSLAASDSSSRSLCHSPSGALRAQQLGDHCPTKLRRIEPLKRQRLPAVAPP